MKKLLKDNSTAIIIASLVIIILVGVYFYGKKNGTTLLDIIDKKIDKDDVSHNATEFTIMADEMYTALNGFFGEDETAIYNILSRLQSSSDYYALVKAFGVRKSDGIVIYFEGNLPQWFYEYLSESELGQIDAIVGKFGIKI
jgi:hypothetical protein